MLTINCESVQETQVLTPETIPVGDPVNEVAKNALKQEEVKAKPSLLGRIKYVCYISLITLAIKLTPLGWAAFLAFSLYKCCVRKEEFLPSLEEAPDFWEQIFHSIPKQDPSIPYVRTQEEEELVNRLQQMLDLDNAELQILCYLKFFTQDTKDFFEFLKGGHFIFEDEGALYELLPKKNPRMSSHKSEKQQYAVRGSFLTEALYGTVTSNEKQCTWIQLEKDPVSSHPMKVADHCVSYLKHLRTGNNIGPRGESPYTDQQPKILKMGALSDF